MGIGNLMGFGGPKPSGRENILGLGGSGSKPQKRVLRNVDKQGVRGQQLRDEARKIGVVRVHKITKENGGKKTESVVYKRTGTNKTEELIEDSFYSGQTDSSRKDNIKKKGGFQSQKNRNVFYKIGGSKLNIERRGKIADIFDPKGPTKEEIAVDSERRERFARKNILETQWSREKNKDKMSGNLSGRREKGAKRAVDFRNTDNTKITADNIGVNSIQSAVSAQSGKEGLNRSSKPGFANKIENPENKHGNVADLSGNKAKDINEDSGTPMFRAGADK
ncbi:MAG: hypothetical protein U9M94_02040 [Patescibacteria group bacterium]|nr:hypothetical protein [Patescibacteria group bacterium]